MPGKAFFAGIGSAGDLFPLLALALAAHRRGHDVRVIAIHRFEGLIRDLGLEFRAPGPIEEYEHVQREPDFRRRSAQFAAWNLRPVYDIIRREHEPGATCVVTQPHVLGALTARETLRVSLVRVHVQPASFRSVYDAPGLPLPDPPRWCGPLARYWRRTQFTAAERLVTGPLLIPGLNRFRAELGLRPLRSIIGEWPVEPDAVLGLFPDWFGAPQPDWPPRTHLTGFPLFDGSFAGELPPDAESFLAAGPPPVVFTTGSSDYQDGERYYRESVRACVESGRRGVLLTPHQRQVPAELPASVRRFDFLPLRLLLERSSALVHHGGVGTSALALAAGVPQIVLPTVHDQPDNAIRVKRLGVAAILRRRTYSAGKVVRTLDHLLTSEAVRANCRLYAARLATGNPIEEACDAIDATLR